MTKKRIEEIDYEVAEHMCKYVSEIIKQLLLPLTVVTLNKEINKGVKEALKLLQEAEKNLKV